MMQEADVRLLTTGSVARQCGVSPDTIRHYEQLGVIPPAVRGANGYRGYPEATVHRVRVVRRALTLGFTLTELARILRQRDGGRPPCRDVYALAAQKLADLDQRLVELHALRETLAGLIESWNHRLDAVGDGEPAHLLETLVSAECRVPSADGGEGGKSDES
jgi:DNA-binding transcriptional MerR regulator